MEVKLSEGEIIRVELDMDELSTIYGSIAVALSEGEEPYFSTRVGYSKQKAQSILDQLSEIIG
ncbi:hypothetical protein [Deinococcus navajonensis]|uniref:Uncharacterized protein n=1 Tax=Deinococcus navajonensis TaxID=309884 RepID=A0ABV8XJK6_9DEIO